MPLCFCEAYGLSVACIVDCYEIRIEKSSNLVAQSATWSQYKQTNTVKVLIAIAPQGSTVFISDAWRGHVSDKFLTRENQILETLLPGDTVLAD